MAEDLGVGVLRFMFEDFRDYGLEVGGLGIGF